MIGGSHSPTVIRHAQQLHSSALKQSVSAGKLIPRLLLVAHVFSEVHNTHGAKEWKVCAFFFVTLVMIVNSLSVC